MEQSSKYSWSWSHIPDGPLVAYIDSFTALLSEQGYSQNSAHLQTRLVADFSRWLKRNKVAVHELSIEHAKRYLRCRARHLRPRRGDVAALRRLLNLLRQLGVNTNHEVQIDATEVELIIEEFALYLRRERVLVTVTIVDYSAFARQFLTKRFGTGHVQLSVLCAADVVAFVQRQATCLHLKRAKLMTTALRSFLRFVRYRGDIVIDLAAAVPAVANWSMASIPRSISPDHAKQVLAHCNRQTAAGKRDYAILLLLARLGLRAGEIATLTLDDIDWEAGHLQVHGKGGRECQLPLPVDVGEAMADYLQQGRPSSSSRYLFLHAKAPICGLNEHGGVSLIVKHAFDRAGIDSPRKGAHQFRHALATKMLRQGASLSEIGELLRHRSPETTRIYAKVDLDSLRTLALPWPGGVR
jgi:integrase/recombinase XerD